MSKEIKLFNNSLERLSRKQDYFKKFDSIWDWVFLESELIVDQELRYFQYIKNVSIKKFWEKDVFISPAALDDIIFHVFKNYPKSEIETKIEEFVIKSRLNRNSVVIFPLHSFGFKFGGLKHLLGGVTSLSYRADSFQIFSQSNSFSRTINQVRDYIEFIKLPNRRKLDYSLFDHFFKSRGLSWFHKNPLMLLHFKFSQQERFDNIQYIMEKIDFITNKVFLLSALVNKEDPQGSNFSTRNTNNWETLDIRHFLTITTAKARADLNCIPVHFSNFRVTEKMQMNMDFLLKRQKLYAWEQKAINSIDFFFHGYMRYKLTGKKEFGKYFRIANSLKYFRRSYKAVHPDDRTININIALETILLDKHETNKRDKMIERVWNALKRKINKKENLKNIEDCIAERNEIVHNGLAGSGAVKFEDVYRTYCKLILFLSENFNLINSEKEGYLSEFYEKI